MKKGLLLCCLLCSFCLPIKTLANNTPTNRYSIPDWLQNTWFEISAGYLNLPYTNKNLENNLTAQKINNPIWGAQFMIGHYFSHYFGVDISLMRTLGNSSFKGIINPTNVDNTIVAFFGIALRPTFPLPHDWILYGESGIEYASRNGFVVYSPGIPASGITGVTSDGIIAPLFGAGVSKSVTEDLFLDWNVRYMLANNALKQPSMFFASFGIYYLLEGKKTSKPREYINYTFPLNEITINYFNSSILNIDASKAFSPPAIPIFFGGKVETKTGLNFMYERIFFHTDKNFSLEWGISVGNYASQQLQQDFLTLSLFPELKIWMVRSPRIDFYFTYSLAGPTYISRKYIDNYNTGGNFTFQDFLGLGVLLGKGKQINLSLKIIHYSNGNLFTKNPGIKVPVLVGLGYSW